MSIAHQYGQRDQMLELLSPSVGDNPALVLPSTTAVVREISGVYTRVAFCHTILAEMQSRIAEIGVKQRMSNDLLAHSASHGAAAIPTSTCVSHGVLMLRNQLGDCAQQWLLRQSKCTIGSAPTCTVRCDLPGIAPHHALLVIGSKQVFLRALAPRLSRNGSSVSELLLTEDCRSFEIAGNRFEFHRDVTDAIQMLVATDQAQPFGTCHLGTQSAAQTELPVDVGAIPKPQFDKPGRIRFSLARPKQFQQNPVTENQPRNTAQIDGSQWSHEWISQIVQSAIAPLHSKLHEMAAPIEELKHQAERTRKRKRTRSRTTRLSSATDSPKDNGFKLPLASESHDKLVEHTRQMEESQRTVEQLISQQTVRIESITERISDITNQISAVERIVSESLTGNVKRSVESNGTDSSLIARQIESVDQLQVRIDSLAQVIFQLQGLQSENCSSDSTWREAIAHQLASLSRTDAVDGLKAGLDGLAQLIRQLQSRQAEMGTSDSTWREVIAGQLACLPTSADLERLQGGLNGLTEFIRQLQLQQTDLQSQQTLSLASNLAWQEAVARQLATLPQPVTIDRLHAVVESMATALGELQTRQIAAEASDSDWREGVRSQITSLQQSADAHVQWSAQQSTKPTRVYVQLEEPTSPQDSQAPVQEPSVQEPSVQEPSVHEPSVQEIFEQESFEQESAQSQVAGHVDHSYLQLDPESACATYELIDGDNPAPASQAEWSQFDSAENQMQIEHDDPSALSSEVSHLVVESFQTVDVSPIEPTEFSQAIEPVETHEPSESDEKYEPLLEHSANSPAQILPTSDSQIPWFSDLVEESLPTGFENDAPVEQPCESTWYRAENAAHADSDPLYDSRTQIEPEAGVATGDGTFPSGQNGAQQSVELSQLPSWWTTEPEDSREFSDEEVPGGFSSAAFTPSESESYSDPIGEAYQRSALYETPSVPQSDSDFLEVELESGASDFSPSHVSSPHNDGISSDHQIADTAYPNQYEDAREENHAKFSGQWSDSQDKYEPSLNEEAIVPYTSYRRENLLDRRKPYSDSESEPNRQVDNILREALADVPLDAPMDMPVDGAVQATVEARDEIPVDMPFQMSAEEPPQPAEALDDSARFSAPESVILPSAPLVNSHDGESDESVEDYMRRLLARMRGVSESEVKLPESISEPKKASETVTKYEDKPTGPAKTTGPASKATDAFRRDSAGTQPFDPQQYVSRSVAPEQSRNMAAMRELANSSARSAIQVSARRRYGTAILLKLSISLVGFTAGATLLLINGWELNIALVATIAAFLVGALWGYDSVCSIKPLLANGKETAKTPAGEKAAAEAHSAPTEVAEEKAPTQDQ